VLLRQHLTEEPTKKAQLRGRIACMAADAAATKAMLGGVGGIRLLVASRWHCFPILCQSETKFGQAGAMY
jgi:hypothetical protein